MSDNEALAARRRGGNWLREPLIHFLVAGVLVFGVYDWLNPSAGNAADASTIVVDRERLLTYMQYRSNAFEADLFNEQLDALDAGQRQRLVDDYVREEALYREALALGLDRGDYIMRQRMVQKLEFLIDGFAQNAVEPTAAQLADFYTENRADYVDPSVYTFSHVFFDREARGADAARSAAEALLPQLNEMHAGFNDATRYGDRPLYLRNYVERTRDYVVGHLGEGLVAALDDAVPSERDWIGPFESPYGWHLVMLTERKGARLPPLAEIEPRVRDDYARVALDRARANAIEQLVAGYAVDNRLLAAN